MKLSYSEYRTYLDCPKKYKLEIDKVEPPEEQSRYFALYGMVVELFFKKYTNFYVKQDITLNNNEIYEILRKLWDQILDENYVCWNDPWVKRSSEEIFSQAYEDILKNLKEFDFWRYAQSEVPIEIILKKTGDLLTCRLDFVINNTDGTVEIIDGKGTEKPDKNIDIEQLYFYALMYLLSNKKLPNKIGFLYYRFQMIKYMEFDKQTMVDFKNKLSVVKGAIKKDLDFKAKVKASKQCRWCAYNSTCDELILSRKKRAEKKKPIVPFDNNGGIISFSPRGLSI